MFSPGSCAKLLDPVYFYTNHSQGCPSAKPYARAGGRQAAAQLCSHVCKCAVERTLAKPQARAPALLPTRALVRGGVHVPLSAIAPASKHAPRASCCRHGGAGVSGGTGAGSASCAAPKQAVRFLVLAASAAGDCPFLLSDDAATSTHFGGVRVRVERAGLTAG